MASTTPARDRGSVSRTPSPASQRSRDGSHGGGRGARGGDDEAASYRTDKYDEDDDDDWSSAVSPRRSRSLTPSPSPPAKHKTARTSPAAKRGPVLGKFGSPAGRKPAAPRAGNGAKAGGVGLRGGRSNKSSRTSVYTGGSGPPPDLVSRRVHSARVHAAVTLRNEVSELQAKLDEATRENRALKQLQHRQEKALARLESQEGDLPQLLARHAGETRALREGRRRAREAERDAAKRLRAAQDELLATRDSLQRLQRLSEQRGLGEREELARSLARAEARLDESERRVKDLEKNLELTANSYQRQLAAERRKTQEAQAQVAALQEEIERLTLKLKDKERELDVKNIYASRLLKTSPRKDNETTPRSTRPTKKGKPATVAVQTDDYFDTINFPPPPSPPLLSPPPHPKQHPPPQDTDAVAARRDRERDDHTRSDKEERDLQNKARKLREEHEREETERRARERRTQEAESAARRTRLAEERRRKDALLAKMREIDDRMSAPAASPDRSPSPTLDDIARKPARPPVHDGDTTTTAAASSDTDTGRTNGQGTHKGYRFPEPVENLHNGVPSHAERDAESSRRRWRDEAPATDELAFGGYAPSFGRLSGRETLPPQQRRDNSPKKGRPTPPGSRDKPGLIEQLFGASGAAGVTAAGEAKAGPAKAGPAPAGKKSFPWDGEPAGDGVPAAFQTHNGRHATVTSTRPAVRAVDSLDDDIEELAL